MCTCAIVMGVFLDMKCEREAFHRQVVPRLLNYAQKLGFDFEVRNRMTLR